MVCKTTKALAPPYVDIMGCCTHLPNNKRDRSGEASVGAEGTPNTKKKKMHKKKVSIYKI